MRESTLVDAEVIDIMMCIDYIEMLQHCDTFLRLDSSITLNVGFNFMAIFQAVVTLNAYLFVPMCVYFDYYGISVYHII
jgi:hypothetical protein